MCLLLQIFFYIPVILTEAHVGVFAKRTIPRCTQFGPFIGELVQNKDDIESTKFLLMVSHSSVDKKLNISDVNYLLSKCL